MISFDKFPVLGYMATPVQDVTIRDRQTDEPDHFQMNVAADFPGKKVIRVRKQGRIRGNPVADGWAGAVMQKPLGIQKKVIRVRK